MKSIEFRQGKDDRFEFGENWEKYSKEITEERVKIAVRSLQEMLGLDSLEGKSFLDIGCGSGLFSLAARRLGADVHSFDYDKNSVACAKDLRDRLESSNKYWSIEEGSVLNTEYMENLGKFDVVYAWGVLHHTGAMWLAVERSFAAVAGGGLLYIALYNDQGWKSHIWWLIKYAHSKTPRVLRPFYVYFMGFLSKIVVLLKYTLRLKPQVIINNWMDKKNKRGMTHLRDMHDWIGGYPYEFVGFDIIKKYLTMRGCEYKAGKATFSLGCHEWVFKCP